MNIELLKKLVRLANSNPNEHEANLAARKVCKIIEADDFKFNNVPEVKYSGFDTTNSKNPGICYEDLVDMVRRAKANVRNNYSNTGFYDHMYQSYYDEPKRTEKIDRVCTKCGKTVNTMRVTTVFICNNCEWTTYQENKP